MSSHSIGAVRAARQDLCGESPARGPAWTDAPDAAAAAALGLGGDRDEE
jgi:hypothetical protein